MTQVPPYDRDRDERAIRHSEAAYDAAWGAGDIEGVLACLTEDAVLVNPRWVARGHREIRRQLGAFLRGDAAGSKHTSVVSRIEFITEDVVLVDGQAVIEGTHSRIMHGYTDVLIRTGRGWLIAHVRAYGLTEVPPLDTA